jgi:hypothetical protein
MPGAPYPWHFANPPFSAWCLHWPNKIRNVLSTEVYSLFSTYYIKLTAILIISGEEKPLGKDIDTNKKSK